MYSGAAELNRGRGKIESAMTTEIGRWRVAETTQETVFTLGADENWWMYAGAIVLLWVGYFVQRDSGPWRAMDIGLVWGFSLVSLLLISIAVNRVEVRLGPAGMERKVGPLPVMEGSKRYARAEIVGVHYWQQATSGKRIGENWSRPTYKAGVRLKSGAAIDAVNGFDSMEKAQEAAEVIGRRLGLEASQFNRANEPTGWRGILFLFAIVFGSVIVGRMASFLVALWQEF